MKNTIVKFILFIALGGFIISCKKQGEQQSVFFPETLYFTQLTKKTEVRLLTKAGEIKDADIIARFIQNVPNFNLPSQPLGAIQKIILHSKSTATFGESNLKYDLNSDFATRKTEFIFYSQQQNAVNSLAYLLLKIKAPLITKGSPPNVSHTTKDVKVANGNYLDLNFSVLSYKIKQGESETIGTVYNQPITIDANALAQLQTTDTIAVQEFIANYKSN